METTNCKFTVAHVGRIMSAFHWRIEDEIRRIAQNDGKLMMLSYGDEREASAMTDAHIEAYAAGILQGALSLAAWLEEDDVTDGEDPRPILARHNATSDQWLQQINGAVGVCMFRRHPEKKTFAGRFRKLNELIGEIRKYRVDLDNLYSEGLGSGNTLEKASQFAYEWRIGRYSAIRSYLSDYGAFGSWSRPLDEEHRRAVERTAKELCAAEIESQRLRNIYSDELNRASKEAFWRAA